MACVCLGRAGYEERGEGPALILSATTLFRTSTASARYSGCGAAAAGSPGSSLKTASAPSATASAMPRSARDTVAKSLAKTAEHRWRETKEGRLKKKAPSSPARQLEPVRSRTDARNHMREQQASPHLRMAGCAHPSPTRRTSKSVEQAVGAPGAGSDLMAPAMSPAASSPPTEAIPS